MRQVVDRLAGVVAARVAGDHLAAGDDPHGRRAGQEGERPADVRVGNRIAIAVEADVGRLAGRDGAQHIGREGMRGQRQEPRLLLGEDLRDGLIALLGMRPLMRHVVAPLPKLRVEVVDVAKGAGGEEGVPQVLNLPLDFPFLVPAAGGAGAGRGAK